MRWCFDFMRFVAQSHHYSAMRNTRKPLVNQGVSVLFCPFFKIYFSEQTAVGFIGCFIILIRKKLFWFEKNGCAWWKIVPCIQGDTYALLSEFCSTEHCKQEPIEYHDYCNNCRIKAKLKALPPAIYRQQVFSAVWTIYVELFVWIWGRFIVAPLFCIIWQLALEFGIILCYTIINWLVSY